MNNIPITPLLSICIPTYNNGQLLDEAINSIIGQVNENLKDTVEICISDNASSDDTPTIINKWKLVSPINIYYRVNGKNLGFDYNLLKVVGMANGTFCWPLGSDDLIEKDSIKQVLNLINNNSEVGLFILSRRSYDFQMKKIVLSSDPLKRKFNQNIKFRNTFDAIANTASTISCFSILVFNKKKWDQVTDHEEFIGSIYIHIYKVLSMIKSGITVMYIATNLVKCRSGNDYYLQKLKYIGRLKKDIIGYSKISKKVFGKNSEEYNNIMNQFIGDHLRGRTIAGIKMNGNKNEVKELFQIYYKELKKNPKFWFCIFPFILVPSFVYSLASRTFYRNQYKTFKKNVENVY